MNLAAFIYLFLTLIKFSYSKLSEQCSKSNTFWYSIKYPYIDLLRSPSTQSSVFSCPPVSSQSCCSSDINKDMSRISELKLKEYSEEKLEAVVMMLSNDSFDLMSIYLKDLENTKNDLNQLFSSTYGYNYKVHKKFFFSWFDKLKLYMQGKLHNIGQLLDNFFLEMAQRIVRILVAEGSSPEITACHTTRLIESKPYQDTDVLLKKKIIRSYPPARLLVNGIAVGRDVFGELMKNVSPTSNCIEKYNTIFHCLLCQGLIIKPCSQTCTALMDNCFGSFKASDIKKLDKMLTKYIKTLIQLAGKLENPFNFPEVNNKMNVQISTAIMNVQNMYPNVKEQIKAKCQGGGDLPISRKKRQASKEFYNWQNANNNNNNNQGKPWLEENINKNKNEEKKEKKDFSNYQNKPNDALTPFARKIMLNYKGLENYFKNNKMKFCSTISTSDVTVDCWNGTTVIKSHPSASAKESKKKNEKVDNAKIKSALNQLNEITKRIISYLNDANTDPETVVVKEYKMYTSPKVKKPVENPPQSSLNMKIEGSGDLEGNKLPQPNLIPEKPKTETNEVPPPPPPDKQNWQFPAWPEGSGDKDNKLPIDKTKEPLIIPIKESTVSTKSTASSTLSSTKTLELKVTKSTTVTPNQIPDDEDINPPPPPESKSKTKETVITSSSISPIIQPEGSGNQPALPDLSEKKEPALPLITTTPLPEPVEGSGDEFKPKTPVDKPGPFLPMLPDQSKTVTDSPIKKPDIIPDEEVVPVEGSGISPEPPIDNEQPPPIQQRNPSTTTIIIEPSTTVKSESLPPEDYPGKVPSEVWLPGLEGVKNPQKGNQYTTPSGRGLKVLGSDLKTNVCRITLILLSIYTIV